MSWVKAHGVVEKVQKWSLVIQDYKKINYLETEATFYNATTKKICFTCPAIFKKNDLALAVNFFSHEEKKTTYTYQLFLKQN